MQTDRFTNRWNGDIIGSRCCLSTTFRFVVNFRWNVLAGTNDSSRRYGYIEILITCLDLGIVDLLVDEWS